MSRKSGPNTLFYILLWFASKWKSPHYREIFQMLVISSFSIKSVHELFLDVLFWNRQLRKSPKNMYFLWESSCCKKLKPIVKEVRNQSFYLNNYLTAQKISLIHSLLFRFITFKTVNVCYIMDYLLPQLYLPQLNIVLETLFCSTGRASFVKV